MKARKKPVDIEFIQFMGATNIKECMDFCGADKVMGKPVKYPPPKQNENMYWALHIETLEGTMIVSPRDYIIKGVNGEFYPCKPDIFDKTYDIVEEQLK